MMATCPVCSGSGKVPDHSQPMVKDTNVRSHVVYKPCPNPKCVAGRVPDETKSGGGGSGCVVLLPLLGLTTLMTAIAFARIV